MLDLNFVNKTVQSEFYSSTSVSSDVFNDQIVTVDDDDCVSYSDGVGESVDLITRQFFPVCSNSEMEELGCGLMTSSVKEIGTDWLNLKVPESMVKMPVQKVKKSRRGPPSRSSQYRGVTFYRRTGRWESHRYGLLGWRHIEPVLDKIWVIGSHIEPVLDKIDSDLKRHIYPHVGAI